MSDYLLTWLTDDLATGYAPMSYEDLDSIRAQGIDAIVNLCAEFGDLHEIEEGRGFEVYYLPIEDECAPDMAELEKALVWLDESIYLGKKVLVHCRHGIGRTGTFVTSYLLRRGLGLKLASKTLRKNRAQPSNYGQWKLLKKYGRKQGVLKIREPSLESRNVVDLSVYFAEYESLLRQIDEARAESPAGDACPRKEGSCCYEYRELQLIEVIYLTAGMNRVLKSEDRLALIGEAVEAHRNVMGLKREAPSSGIAAAYAGAKILCPLNRDELCSVHTFRPLACRLHGLPSDAVDRESIRDALARLSSNVFFAFSGLFLDDRDLTFTLPEAVSGKYVQEYFYYLASLATGE
jgi:protein-tyrosine phosphatase/Fe-S-cluster containining protein